MVHKVPAYKKFLGQHGIRPGSVKTAAWLAEIPAINKKNYFSQFPVSETFWPKSKQEPLVVTSTSGSTGQPAYFLRNEKIDWQYSVLAEFFLKNGPKGSTLLINCFGMGVWIGGLITYQAFRYAALRGYPLSIVTPGINKTEIFHCLGRLAPNFENIIFAGYPPFIKDVIDEALEEKINLSKLKIRLLFAAESFTETFRDYVARKANVRNIYLDTLNIYGSAELGAMAFETPGSIFIRRQSLKHPRIYEQLFIKGRLPTLAQYNPMFVSFEEKNGEILINADGAMPIFKYSIGDRGGTLTLGKIEKIFAGEGINLRRLVAKNHISFQNLPFVYIYERADFSTKLYGATIYPEPIKEVAQRGPLAEYLTGKFTMQTKFNRKQNQTLEINFELKRETKPTKKLRFAVQKAVIAELVKKNAEYKNNYSVVPHKVLPKIVLWPHSSTLYFKPGIKQKWIKKA